MTERPSMWSQAMLTRYAAEAVCPNADCGEMNLKTKKHLITVNELGAAECAKCGEEWTAPRPVVRAVNE